ncbi:MAG: response regulator [Rhodospirillales bacterium]
MAKDFSFDNVVIFLVDPDRFIRDTIRSILNNRGFQNFIQGANVKDIRSQLDTEAPDLLIADSNIPGGDFCDLVHELRHNEIGSNPFLPVIATTWDPTAELVKRVIESGSDDLLPKPLSSGHLIARIEALVKARKPFVVTSEYIGPDRRKSTDRDSSIPLLQVPNSLRVKVTGEDDAAISQEEINQAIAEINIQKLERHAFQIEWLVERLVPALTAGTLEGETNQHLDRLLFVAQDISRRLVGTKYEHISELCRSLSKVAMDIGSTRQNPNTKDIKLLVPLSQAIASAFDPNRDDVAAARDIAGIVGR